MGQSFATNGILLETWKKKLQEILEYVLQKLEKCANDSEYDSIDFWISASSINHWNNPPDYALRNGSFML